MEIAAVARATTDPVKGRVEEAKCSLTCLCRLLVGKYHHRGPHRSSSRGATDRHPATCATETTATRGTSRTINWVARRGIGIERDIRNFAHTIGVRILYAWPALPRWLLPELADAAATRAAKKAAIPHRFGRIAVAAIQRQVGAANASVVGLRGGIIGVEREIEAAALQLEAAFTATIACRNEDGLPLRGCLLEELVLLGRFLLPHVLLAIAPAYADNGSTVFDDAGELVVVALRGIGGFVDKNFGEIGSHAEQHLDIQFNLDCARSRLTVEAIQDDILQSHVCAAKALRVGLNIALRVAIEFKDAHGLPFAMQSLVVQTIIVVGLRELTGNVGHLRAAACPWSRAVTRARTACRDMLRTNGRVIVARGIIQACERDNIRGQISRKRGGRGVGVESPTIRGTVVVDGHMKDALCQGLRPAKVDEAGIGLGDGKALLFQILYDRLLLVIGGTKFARELVGCQVPVIIGGRGIVEPL